MNPEIDDLVEILDSIPEYEIRPGNRGKILRQLSENTFEVECIKDNGEPVLLNFQKDRFYHVWIARTGEKIPLTQQLDQIVDQLPENKVREVLNWARFLASQSKIVTPQSAEKATSIWSKDIFVLGTPVICSDRLFEHQLELQELFGGQLISPIHFTFQRFRCFDESILRGFLSDLRTSLSQISCFPVHALSIVPLYSEFRHARVLKWHISLSEPLQRLSDTLEKILLARGGKSLLPARWMSDLITSLEDIQELGFHRDLRLTRIPEPLFTIEQVVISQFTNQGDFQTLEVFPLTASS